MLNLLTWCAFTLYAVKAQFVYPTSTVQLTGPADTFVRLIQQALPPERLPVTGFGFSNPPPPLGADIDPATRSCGIPPPFCANTRYRTIDGTCNNLARPLWGVPQTPYGRLTPFSYADGISALPVSSNGNPLPNARTVSLQLFPDRQLVDPIWNLNAQQWGQVIAHDMSLTSGIPVTRDAPINCCDDRGRLTPDSVTNPKCAPILIPADDPVHARQGTQCMNFVRSGTTRDRGCTDLNAPGQALNTVTSFMDLSLTYGSSMGQAAPLRANQGGLLITTYRNGRRWPPQDPNMALTCESAQSPIEPCYLAGDIRVNQNPQLTVLQVILLREHNRIAKALQDLNPHWSDEILFQEARRIHIAEYQHINYYEYLPIFLGYANMVKNKLIYPGATGYINDYSPNVDPSVLDEFGTAAFRLHSLIRGFLKLITEKRQVAGAVRLSDWFDRPLLLEINHAFEDLTRGLTVQQQDFNDQFLDSEITQFLFRRNNTFGGDLRATDILRGRDHGLGSYTAARAACGLPVPKGFNDLHGYISRQNIQLLRGLYESVTDIDLIVGGSLEHNVPGALVGPTVLCILTEQFYRTRAGDRYFYENGADPDIAFTPKQLQSIRNGASMARILCDNVDSIRSMQPNAFEQLNFRNQLVPCDQLPFIDLTLWQDTAANFNK